MNKSNLSAVGISSLLVIFAVLCLAVFALLSVSTVQAQKRLAESSREAVTGYYRADCEAEEILASLRGGESPEGVTQSGDIFTYACRISDTQVLAVSVKLNGNQYTILQWQAISAVDWEAEDKLPVWDGQGT
ncbi:MAG: hypothetical protein J6Q30_02825 [Oscillospiraceae bacterium]|nr:hypothetical protein [Oscillospiraceae bacterium]